MAWRSARAGCWLLIRRLRRWLWRKRLRKRGLHTILPGVPGCEGITTARSPTRIDFAMESAGIPWERRPRAEKHTIWSLWVEESAGWRQLIFTERERERMRAFWSWTITTISAGTPSATNLRPVGARC